MLVPLKLQPGLFQNGTLYQAKDRWARGSLVRFYEKTIRPVGGWQEFTASADVDVDHAEALSIVASAVSEFPKATSAYTDADTRVSGTVTFEPGSGGWGAVPTDFRVQVRSTGNVNGPFDTTGEYNFFRIASNGFQSWQFWFYYNANGGIPAVLGTATYSVAPSTPDAGSHTWRTVVSGQNFEFYFDGILQFSGTTVAAALPAGAIRIQLQEAPADHNPANGFYSSANTSTVTAIGHPAITLDGVPRSILGWRGSDGNQTVAVGTNTKLYAHLGGRLYNITPSGFTAGAVDAAYATGNYGSGVYGAGPYGVSDPAQTTFAPPAVWHLDTFGEYLVGCCTPNDGKLYIWDRSVNDIAVAMSGAPTQCNGVVVTPERFVVALGAGNVSRHIQWASQETTNTWTPDVSNTAGSLDLEGVGILVAGRRGKGETILWTTDDVHALRYIGGTLVYALERVGGKCGLLSPGAVAMVDDKAVWMSKGQFFLYDGYVQAIPCDVSDEVFSDFNPNQSGKVTALPISRFGEIWWFYPSANSTENDKYVVWNYRENHWTTGDLPRTAGCDSGAIDYPLLASPNGKLWEHERTFSHTDLAGNTLAPYLESGPVEAGQGDQVLFISQILPDERTLGQVELSLYGSFEPMATETLYGPFTINKNTDARMTARWVRLRLDQVVEEDWRVGVIRLDGVPAGARGSPR